MEDFPSISLLSCVYMCACPCLCPWPCPWPCPWGVSMYVRKAMREKDIIRSGVQWAVCTAPVCTPHNVTNHPYTNMESITRAYLGLLELEEEEADEEEVLLAAAVLATSKRRRRRRHWVQPINQRRPQYGAYHHLVAELLEDGENFQRYFRMTREQFAQII